MAIITPDFIGSYAKKYGMPEDKFMKVCPTCKGCGTVKWRVDRYKVVDIPCPNRLFHKTQEEIEMEDAIDEVNSIAPGWIDPPS